MAQMMRRFASRPVRSSRGGNLARHAGAGRQIVRADDAGANRTVPVRKGSATNQLSGRVHFPLIDDLVDEAPDDRGIVLRQ